MNKRLNYKECRERIFRLLEGKSMLNKEEIWNALGLIDNENKLYMHYAPDHLRFHAFLNHTRKFAYRGYCKAKKLRVSFSNLIFFRGIIEKKKINVDKFIQFCEIERIPFLYYVPKIKEYIFPNGLLLYLLANKHRLIRIKSFLASLKTMEIFHCWNSIDDIINYLKATIFIEKEFGEIPEETEIPLVLGLIRKYYTPGEKKEKMFERLGFEKDIKNLNQEIEKNLYSIANLELEKKR